MARAGRRCAAAPLRAMMSILRLARSTRAAGPLRPEHRSGRRVIGAQMPNHRSPGALFQSGGRVLRLSPSRSAGKPQARVALPSLAGALIQNIGGGVALSDPSSLKVIVAGALTYSGGPDSSCMAGDELYQRDACCASIADGLAPAGAAAPLPCRAAVAIQRC